MMKRQFGSLTISPGETLESRRARRLGAGGGHGRLLVAVKRCQRIGGTIQRGEAKASPSNRSLCAKFCACIALKFGRGTMLY